jgi:hypothetical protein
VIITLKITCVGGAYLVESCVRVIEIDDESSLFNLHGAIQDAVDFGRDHPFDFFLAHVPQGNRQPLSEAEEWEDREGAFLRIPLQDVFPTGRKRLYYLFDFGDCWTFEVRKARGSKLAEKGAAYPRLLGSEGPNPIQYPCDTGAGKSLETGLPAAVPGVTVQPCLVQRQLTSGSRTVAWRGLTTPIRRSSKWPWT